MKISVIIPTYNRAELVGITIQSFLEQNYPKDKFEIIVANNNSSDDTEDILKEYSAKFPNFKYFNETRQGVHYARNSAAHYAKGEILYYTDDDMIADQNLLTEITKPFQIDDKVATATGRVLPKWEVAPPNWILKHCNNYLLSLLSPNYDFIIADSIDYLYSCHLAIRKDVFFKVEGFNPEYTKDKYMGDGETGLNTKVRILGYKFGYNGKSVIFHIIPKTRFTQAYLNKRFKNNGRAHAYSSFKKGATISYLLLHMGKNLIYRLPLDISKTIIKPILKKDFSLYRFFIGRLYYWYGNISFNFSILLKRNLRKFVLKNDWLSNDKEFDTINI